MDLQIYLDQNQNSTTQSTLFQALSTLTPPQLHRLTATISALFRLHRRRLLSILSSPSLFSLTLRHLHSLSLPQKSLLVARHLTSLLSILHPLPSRTTSIRDLDSALLLLLLAEVRHVTPNALRISSPKWRSILSSYLYHNTVASVSSIHVSTSTVLIQYVEIVARCRNYVGVMGCGSKGAAAAAAVVGLPSVEVTEEIECVVCKETMRVGRDVCKLPCGHLFHWGCILPWLKARDTCPCCRGRLPSNDVAGEVRRLWEAVEKAAEGGKMVI